MLDSATVTAIGTAPPISSATHSISVRRSTVESLLTSVAMPRIATPWTLLASSALI
jgi:hypothetical protein